MKGICYKVGGKVGHVLVGEHRIQKVPRGKREKIGESPV